MGLKIEEGPMKTMIIYPCSPFTTRQPDEHSTATVEPRLSIGNSKVSGSNLAGIFYSFTPKSYPILASRMTGSYKRVMIKTTSSNSNQGGLSHHELSPMWHSHKATPV
jgi:hypothetical protein